MKGSPKKVTEAEVKRCVAELNAVVRKHSFGSVLRALDVVSAAFSVMLDMYALPNEENPEGMCDDLPAFRAMYANFIAKGSGNDGVRRSSR